MKTKAIQYNYVSVGRPLTETEYKVWLIFSTISFLLGFMLGAAIIFNLHI